MSGPVREPGRPIEALERELKFVLPAGRAETAARWLQTLCAADPTYPAAEVWTVYYDTPSLASLGEKLNSDYLKSKIRVRWYAVPGHAPAGAVFLEAKLRVGSRRDKLRLPLPERAEALWTLPLDAAPFCDMPVRLASQGIRPDGRLVPMLALRYRRDRFVEPDTGARIALDRDIRTVRVNSRYLTMLNLGPLPSAVLEVKGHEERLPDRLEPLLRLGARKQTFSKYAAVWNHARRDRQ